MQTSFKCIITITISISNFIYILLSFLVCYSSPTSSHSNRKWLSKGSQARGQNYDHFESNIYIKEDMKDTITYDSVMYMVVIIHMSHIFELLYYI